MNLHAIVSGAIAAVNPLVPMTIQRSIGYTTNTDGTQVPTYAPPIALLAQVQALSADDLHQIDGLNIQGEKRAVYINGRTDGIIRQDGKGGDLIIMNPMVATWFIGFVTADTLVVDQLLAGEIDIGQTIFSSNPSATTKIAAFGTGSGGAGSYSVDPPLTDAGPVFQSSELITWLNVHVLEYWPDWCKFIITRQNGS